MNDDHDRLAGLDAAYALGALDPAEAREYEAHLAWCGECRARADQARDTTALLALLGPQDEVLGDEPVPDTLLPGLLRRASRERLRRRGVLAAGVVAVAACLTALLVAVWPDGSTTPLPPGQSVAARDFAPLAATPVRANASLVSKDWGTQIDVHCSYAVGVRQAYRYSLRVVGVDGENESAGGWKVEPDHDVSYVGGTSLDLRDIRYVQILAPDGTPVLQLST